MQRRPPADLQIAQVVAHRHLAEQRQQQGRARRQPPAAARLQERRAAKGGVDSIAREESQSLKDAWLKPPSKRLPSPSRVQAVQAGKRCRGEPQGRRPRAPPERIVESEPREERDRKRHAAEHVLTPYQVSRGSRRSPPVTPSSSDSPSTSNRICAGRKPSTFITASSIRRSRTLMLMALAMTSDSETRHAGASSHRMPQIKSR